MFEDYKDSLVEVTISLLVENLTAVRIACKNVSQSTSDYIHILYQYSMYVYVCIHRHLQFKAWYAYLSHWQYEHNPDHNRTD